MAEVSNESPSVAEADTPTTGTTTGKQSPVSRLVTVFTFCRTIAGRLWHAALMKKQQLFRHSIKHGTLIFSGIAAAASVVSAVFFYESLRYSNDSLKVALDGYQRGYVDHLSARYSFSGDDEYLVLSNPGLMRVSSIRLRRVPYFVLEDKAFSVKGLGVALRSDPTLFNKLREAGLAQSPRDYFDLMGPDREISISELFPEDQAQVEVSRSANENGVRVADALGGIFVIDWIASFANGPESAQTSQNLEFWVSRDNTREDLIDESWGRSVAKRIEDTASTSKDYLLEVQQPPAPTAKKKHR